jgi:Ca2+-transporting ATPase
VLREPMLALLLAGGIAYLLLGDLTEALILLAFATFSVAAAIIQENRTEHVLEALRDLSAPRALVIRDGANTHIAARDVVRDDLIVLEQGDRIAADAVIVEANELLTDESLLTGESMPVGKIAGNIAANAEVHRPGGDGQPFVYSGSLVARGSGLARVLATGPRSEIGRSGQSLATLDTETPRLRTETTRTVALCAIGGGAVALLVVLLYRLLRGGWIEAVLAGIAIGMSMLSVEFPVVRPARVAPRCKRCIYEGVFLGGLGATAGRWLCCQNCCQRPACRPPAARRAGDRPWWSLVRSRV